MSEAADRELTQRAHRHGRSTRRRWPAYLLLIVGFAAVLAGLGWQAIQQGYASPATLGDQSLGLPARLAGVTASQPEFGADALQNIELMHGKGFPMTNGAVVHYGSATAWVAQATDQSAAKALTDDMTAKIAGGRSPFSPTGMRQVGGRAVYTLTGMGQSHFYWQAGAKVVWLAIDPGQSGAGLQELVRAIQ